MVGVPGKYKGCETCRARRVKCDNERPYCKKCVDSGRQCAGYERETVFIIGTVQDEGRCSSHPPRIVKRGSKRGHSTLSSRASSRATSTTSSRGASRSLSPAIKKEDDRDRTHGLVPIPPLQPAWDDLITLSNSKKNYRVQTAALQTDLDHVIRNSVESSSTQFNIVNFPPYHPPDVQPYFAETDHVLSAQCLVHLAEGRDQRLRNADETEAGTDSLCMFLYEHNNSLVPSAQAPWIDQTDHQTNLVQQLGPANFRTFPNHHFFVRVYRHSAITTALLNRKPTFLSSHEWQTIPWDIHPKSYLDTLFDMISSLPAIFYRADQIFLLDPTIQRRLMAQDLLSSCLALEHQLNIWYGSLTASNDGLPTFYPDSTASDQQLPFTNPLAFPDSLTATTMIYYWTALVLFYPCIERLYQLIYQPTIDPLNPLSYAPDPILSPHFLMNPAKYAAKEVRELAGLICRGLDFALNGTTQPDLLLVPLHAVQEFYRFLAVGGDDVWDGQLEVMWCEGFKVRLAMKGQDIGEVVGDGGKGWVEVGRW